MHTYRLHVKYTSSLCSNYIIKFSFSKWYGH